MKPVYVRPESGDSVKRATCYVCGCPRYAEYPLAVRQQATGPYFPFLETHEPPDGSEPPSPDGRVLSCFLCYSYLTQQWQLYERDKVPPVKRIYWLKRVDNGPYTGVEVGVQSEYASQLLGLAPDPPPPTDIKRPGPSGSTRAQPSPAASAAPPAASIEVKRSRIVPPQPQPPSLPLPPPGVPPLPHGLTIPQVGPQQEALDLSLDGRRGTKREREEDVAYRDPRPPAVTPPRTEVLDLRMPDKNATTEVCYVCGDHHKKGTLVDIYAKQQSGSCPFFPSLMLHPRPSKSHPMEASGRVQGCRDCYRHLQLQWDAYEVHNIPHGDRNYSLRKRSSSLLQDCTAFVCYKCGRECPSSSLCLIYCKPNSENEPYYPFIQKLDPPEGASPISPQGMVQVCSVCYKTIPQEQRDLQKKRGDNGSNKSPRGSVTDGSGGGEEQRDSASPQHPPALTPPTHQVLPRAASTAAADGDPHMEEATCYLCHQNHARQAMHWLAMVAEGTFQDGMYFSFLKYLPRIGQNSVVENGRVLACSPCFHHLSTQWNEYEKDKIPKEHRQFSLRAMPTNSHSPRLTPGPTHSSPGTSPSDSSPPHGFSAAIEAHLKSSEIVKKAPPGYAGQPLHTLEVVPAEQDSKAPTLPVITTQNALNIAINCFVCSFHSKAGQTYALRSKPHGSEPFFPFLEKHQSAHPEARVNDSCVLACLCCFHSLILQWQRYEKEQVAHYARLYDTYNYSCFICSLKTYRKRLYLLPVKDYPFLKDHNRPSGGMVVDNGHSVVVCKDCYSSLKNQAVDGSGSRSGVVNLCEDPPSPASSALPKLIESVSIPVESTETSCVGSIPSCHAPLQLKIGVARQGGTQHNTLTKQHSVAPSEGLNSGDAKQPRHARQKLIPVDQSSKRLNTENLHAANLSKEHISSSQATTHNQLNNEDKVAHKKRKSVIRGSMESTRSKTEVWLIGQHITEITGAQLPSRGDVLRLFFHGHNEHKKTVNDSASEVAASVISFWNIARIPTITEKSIGRKVVDLFLMWKGLKKNCTRTTDTQRKKEETFCDELEDLFDVAHPKAMQLLTIKEDRAFLAAQREKGRRGVMAGVDKKIACSIKRREESKSKQSLQQNQASSALEYDELGSSSETESQSSSSSSTSSLAISPVVSSSNRKRATLKVITPELSSTLDRTGISHRSALRIVSATAASLGHDPMELVLNYETVRTSRATHRSGIANEIKEKFQPSEVLTVHWDGKIIPDEQGASVDRIAILVSGINTEKLLGVPKLLSGTGQAIATAVSAALEEWKISENVSALSFDTTASNTGHLSGACVILEQKLGRRLLHLACRHHILELVAEKAYVECMGPSSGPDNTLFSRFKHKWKDISQDDYSPLSDLPPSFYEKRDDLICCWKHHLGKKQQPRDDYREVLELAIRCLDGALPKFNLRRPGALHRARWMAKLIYVMKILIFANQFKLTAHETLGLKRFTFFVLEVYVSAWFTASVPSSASANDLRLLQDLSEYHDVKISRTCLTVFGRHLWYLSEGLVGLALFDPQVNATMKTNIVRAIVERKATEDSPKRAALPATSSLPTKQLSDFASRGSNFLFESLKMKTSFLSKEPDTWSDDEDFKTGVAVVGGLRVINDTAERGIALIQAFNSKITKSEDQRQHLLQVVEEQRRSQPGTSKQDLTSKKRKQ